MCGAVARRGMTMIVTSITRVAHDIDWPIWQQQLCYTFTVIV